MIVVADTSPINYLVLIDAIGVLPELYQTVVIPKAVFEELQTHETPEKVRIWVNNPHEWFKIEQATPLLDSDLSDLDKGEREAIFLSEYLKADALVIDDRAGREEAKKRGIFVIGTLGVLNSATEKGLIDLPEALQKIRRTSFRASDRLISQLLQVAANPKTKSE